MLTKEPSLHHCSLSKVLQCTAVMAGLWEGWQSLASVPLSECALDELSTKSRGNHGY